MQREGKDRTKTGREWKGREAKRREETPRDDKERKSQGLDKYVRFVPSTGGGLILAEFPNINPLGGNRLPAGGKSCNRQEVPSQLPEVNRAIV